MSSLRALPVSLLVLALATAGGAFAQTSPKPLTTGNFFLYSFNAKFSAMKCDDVQDDANMEMGLAQLRAGVETKLAPIAAGSAEAKKCIEGAKEALLTAFKVLLASSAQYPKVEAALKDTYIAQTGVLEGLLGRVGETRREFAARKVLTDAKLAETTARAKMEIDLAVP